MVAMADKITEGQSADVTIYGMVCEVSEFCELEFESIEELVVHLVNDHNEMWSAEGSLKDIKIDGDLLEEVRTCRMLIEEGGHIECKKCGKSYKDLDCLLYHILNEHPGIFKGNKFKISAEFLLKNGYVFDNNYEDGDYVLEVKHESERIRYSSSLSKHWEDIESDEEFDYYQEEEVKSKANVETESAEVESRSSDFDVTIGDDYRDYEEVETVGLEEECLGDLEDKDAAPASDNLNEEDVDPYPVTSEEEVIYECGKLFYLKVKSSCKDMLIDTIKK